MNHSNLKNTALLLTLTLALSACGKTDSAEPPAAAPAVKEEPAAGGAIQLSAEQLKSAEIGIAKAGPASIRETLPLYGVIAPNAEKMREVAARFPGVIRNISKKVGDPVRQGESLASIESNESLQTYALASPLTGVITARNANPGEQTGEKMLFSVADLSTVWVELSLFPRDVARVRVGQSVRVKSTEAGLQAEGKVVYVAPFGQAANQTLTARVLLDNSERRWAPGLYVTAEVTLAETTVPLSIRSEAVQMIDDHPSVFVQEQEGFKPHEVKLGRRDSETVEVLSGLAAGDAYATANSFVLKAEFLKAQASDE